MMQCLVLHVLVLLALATGRPQNLEDSISSVIRSLEAVEPPRRTRPRIITKYDFINTRDKKSHLEVPPPFVVSTGLTVTQREQNQASPYRTGRSQKLFGSRQAKTNFVNLKEAVAAAPLVDGVRVPDDASDRVVHRNGRFINNVFIPNSEDAPIIGSPSKFLPGEFVVSSQINNREQLTRSGRSYLSENEGYDTSAYTFEPADPYAWQQQQQHANVLPASNEDFIIQQKTYQSCPDCPSFSIPVPVPKNSISSIPTQEKSLMARLVDLMQPALNTAKGFFSQAGSAVASTEFANRVSSVEEGGDKMPVYAGLAMLGLGVAAVLGSSSLGGRSVGGRRLDGDIYQSLNILGNDILDYDFGDGDLGKYDMEDLLCLPRNYCERLQSKKYLLDQYPNIKKVASWMANKYFEGVDISEKQEYSKCNIRECIMSLLD